jgi:carboxypeptidase Taq
MQDRLKDLKARLLDVYDLRMAAAVLSWDQSTYMPTGGGEARGRQLAILSRIAHERFTDAAVGKLLDQLEPWAAQQPYDSDEAALIRLTRREYNQSVKVPAEFIAEFNNHSATIFQTWAQARPKNDFKSVAPLLQKTLDLSRRYAEYFKPTESPADPMIELSDYGMKASTIRTVFGELRGRLVPIVKAITSKPPTDDSFIKQPADADKQLAFGIEVIKAYGYDFDRGRQDLTHHPFMTKFSLGDIRITTRVQPNDFTDSLFSTLHESGHAMYEQGIRLDFEGTPLATGTSSGVHESQSRTWENIVGRSRAFWTHFFPRIQQTFPEQLKGVSLDAFYRAINKVQPSLIRVDADEVTYNLHVMIRFDLELDLLEGRLKIADLPEAWHARYQQDLGVRAPSDQDGVLQDVHWYSGFIGGQFQGYTLGNIMGAQFHAAAVKKHPTIPAEIAKGQFGTLHGWLRENVYQHGAKFTAAELLQRVTGKPMGTDDYIEYLWTKYQPMYQLEGEPARV